MFSPIVESYVVALPVNNTVSLGGDWFSCINATEITKDLIDPLFLAVPLGSCTDEIWKEGVAIN